MWGCRITSLHFLPHLPTAFTTAYTLRTVVPLFLVVFLLHIVRRASTKANLWVKVEHSQWTRWVDTWGKGMTVKFQCTGPQAESCPKGEKMEIYKAWVACQSPTVSMWYDQDLKTGKIPNCRIPAGGWKGVSSGCEVLECVPGMLMCTPGSRATDCTKSVSWQSCQYLSQYWLQFDPSVSCRNRAR